MTTDRRHPLRSFDKSLIQDFLQGREVLSAHLFLQGKSNSNYKLVLETGESFVLRLYGGGNAGLETYVMNLVRDFVAVPEEVYRGDDWSVISLLDGEPLHNMPQFSGAAAETLAKISTVVFESSGMINPDGSISRPPFVEKGFVQTSLENPQVRKWIGEDGVVAMAAVLQKEASRYAELDGERRLVHGDFNPTNILIKEGKVSGVLDWEFSHSGNPYEDIGNLVRHTDPRYLDDIRAGLETGGIELTDDWQERAELMDISSQFDFLTSGRSDEFKQICVNRINEFIRKFA